MLFWGSSFELVVCEKCNFSIAAYGYRTSFCSETTPSVLNVTSQRTLKRSNETENKSVLKTKMFPSRLVSASKRAVCNDAV